MLQYKLGRILCDSPFGCTSSRTYYCTQRFFVVFVGKRNPAQGIGQFFSEPLLFSLSSKVLPGRGQLCGKSVRTRFEAVSLSFSSLRTKHEYGLWSGLHAASLNVPWSLVSQTRYVICSSDHSTILSILITSIIFQNLVVTKIPNV